MAAELTRVDAGEFGRCAGLKCFDRHQVNCAVSAAEVAAVADLLGEMVLLIVEIIKHQICVVDFLLLTLCFALSHKKLEERSTHTGVSRCTFLFSVFICSSRFAPFSSRKSNTPC